MIEWTPSDSAGLAEYLRKSDSKLLKVLQASVALVKSKTMEGAALEAYYKQGQENIISVIEICANPPQVPSVAPGFEDVTVGLN